MDPLTVHSYVSAPREELFDFVADLAARPAFTDHFMRDYRLSNPRSQGVGAGARYLLHPPFNRQYMETLIVELDRPRRIVEAAHGGRGGRGQGEVVFEFSRASQGVTEVELTILYTAGTARERLLEQLGTRRWLRRHSKRALERLRAIFEEPRREPLPRADVAAFEPLKAPRFGIGIPPARR